MLLTTRNNLARFLNEALQKAEKAKPRQIQVEVAKS